MTTQTTCSYCGGAGGNEENLEHLSLCPRFGQPPADVPGFFGIGRPTPTLPRPVMTQEQRDAAQRRGAAMRTRFDAAQRRER